MLIHIIAFPLSLIAIVVLEIVLRKPLYDSPDFKSISSFNSDMPQWMLNAFSRLSVSGGGKTLTALAILSNLSLNGRKRYVYYSFILSMSIVTMLVTKMLYK